MGNIYLFAFVFISGWILIIGTKFKWIPLVDPPEELAWFWSHSTYKKLFGNDSLPTINYIVGTILIIMSLITFL